MTRPNAGQNNNAVTSDEKKNEMLVQAFQTHRDFAKIFLDAYALVSHDRKILSFNAAFCSNFNFKPADVRKAKYFDHVFNTSIENSQHSALDQILQSVVPMRVDEVKSSVLIGEGDYKTLILGSFPYLDEFGGLLGACIILRDVTAESQLQGRYHEKARESITDPLTGLHTRRHFEVVLSREEELVRRNNKKSTLGLLILDLDKFKSINDTYGHTAGDYVLVEVAKILRSVARQSDTLVRYGGEEMLVLLSNTTPGGACVAAEKFRKAIEGHKFVFDGQSLKVTSSVGVTMVLTTDADKLTTLKRADECLYAAKENGRNMCFADFGENRYRVPSDIDENTLENDEWSTGTETAPSAPLILKKGA